MDDREKLDLILKNQVRMQAQLNRIETFLHFHNRDLADELDLTEGLKLDEFFEKIDSKLKNFISKNFKEITKTHEKILNVLFSRSVFENGHFKDLNKEFIRIEAHVNKNKVAPILDQLVSMAIVEEENLSKVPTYRANLSNLENY